MMTLTSHTSHVLQPSNLSCFKSFKTTFRKVEDAPMFQNNHMELHKISLAEWVDQALKQSFTKKNIKFGFRDTCL